MKNSPYLDRPLRTEREAELERALREKAVLLEIADAWFRAQNKIDEANALKAGAFKARAVLEKKP